MQPDVMQQNLDFCHIFLTFNHFLNANMINSSVCFYFPYVCVCVRGTSLVVTSKMNALSKALCLSKAYVCLPLLLLNTLLVYSESLMMTFSVSSSFSCLLLY